MGNENEYLPWLFLLILFCIIAVVLIAVAIGTYFKRKRRREEEKKQYLEYSDKVKNYQGKNTETNPKKLSSKYYDDNGKRKMLCDESERFFDGENNYLLESDTQFVKEFVNYVFSDCHLTQALLQEKMDRIYNSKESGNKTLLDIRYFFKNPRYIILPFHITQDKRSQMILYYCQTRAEKCVFMPPTKFSPKTAENYLAYFNLNSFDDMCFIAYLMVKYPMGQGMSIHGFESGFNQQDIRQLKHDKDFVFEYIYRMMFDDKCNYFPMEKAFVETNARVLKAPGYPDASEYSSKQAEIKAEMQREEILKSGLHNENERKLFFLVKEIYPDAIYQYRDEWLEYYSLDIYIPSLKVAIEYQGGQHYKSVEFYGGKKAFEDIKERDVDKRELCNKRGIKIIEWKYDVPITKDNLDTLLANK